MKTPCNHEDFEAEVVVNRLEVEAGMGAGHYSCDVLVSCRQCGIPFQFLCRKQGVLWDEPAVSVDHLELRAPIHPDDGTIPIPPRIKGFTVSKIV